MTFKPWPHQIKLIEMVREEFRKGNTAVCCVMPCGAGKAHSLAMLAKMHLTKKPNGKVLVCAHREELVAQLWDTFTSHGLSCGVIQASPCRECNPYRQVQIASTQTLVARKLSLDISMLMPDEAAHYSSDKWSELVTPYKARKIPIIGATATPIRADGRGFEGLFDALVIPTSMKELIDQGFLTPYELHAPPSPLRPGQIAQSPVDAYREHASGRKAIVFAGNVKAATEFARQFNDVGILADVVSGETPGGTRRQILDRYKRGEIRVLCNIGVLNEGWDDPPTSCAILARSFGSLSLYIQSASRCLRISPSTGKENAVIIDLYGNCRTELGAPADDREWTLEGDGIKHKKLEQPKERFCPVCKVLLEPDAGRVCDLCGIARPEMTVPEVVNVKLVRYEALQKENPDQRRARFEKLKAIAREKSYSKWQPVMKYKALFGSPPPREWW